MLLSLSSAQLMLAPGGASPVPANATVKAIQIGEPLYIYSVAGLTFAIFVIFLEEALRTQGWSRLWRFNYNDLTSVIVASSIGGHDIGTRALGDKGVWYPDSPNDGQVQLLENDKGVALVDVDDNATTRSKGPVKYGTGRHFSNDDSYSEDIPLV